MSIKPLSRETIRLINSTQVISSIYSAVKELVENSLDAQAQNIEVNLADNGLTLIEVKDNGTGISKEDAPFMALPAYTSKITDFNDLDLLNTYGFRGEGLSAVCQVSDVTVCTKTDDDETVTKYVLDNEGNVVNTELTHGTTGTCVQMRNLFKNFPVRRNLFIKKRITQEIKAIDILLKTYAICQPSIRFTFRVNSNVHFTKLNCKNLVEAFKAVVGVQTFSKLTCMKKCFSKTELHLFVPKKENANIAEISQTGYQFLCVNKRPIKSKEIEKKINKRISEYFSQNASTSRKFIFCLTLKVDPSMLDVNLEPNKDKVFLQNEAAVLKEIDELLLNLYELQDSQISTQGSQGEIVNGVSGMNIDASEKEKEWPACKKRKLDSQNENICSINVADTAKSGKDKPSRKSDNEFLKGINEPILSDPDSNDAENFNKTKKNQVQFMEISESESSELFDIVEDTSIKDLVAEETLSQLPKVDLGEDFDWQEIMNKNKSFNHEEQNPDKPANILNEQIDNVAWSKGQVPGLQSGVVISGANGKTDNEINLRGNGADNEESESFDLGKNIGIIHDDVVPISNGNDLSANEIEEFDWDVNLKKTRRRTPTKRNNDKTPNTSSRTSNVIKKFQHALSDPNQTRIPFAGDNACLNSTAPSAFAMYCAETRATIVRKNPELSPAEVAFHLNRQWKEISSEEREYYRDLAKQYIQNKSDLSLTQSSRKPKSQLSQADKEKNKKQLVSMLENMKKNKAEVRNESMVMRNSVPWDINLSFVNEKFRTPTTEFTRSIVGSLNSLVWILKLNLQLLVFDITDLHAQLNDINYDISDINREYVQSVVDRWFNEKDDMSVFKPFYSIEMNENELSR